jgi:hypothetical protein
VDLITMLREGSSAWRMNDRQTGLERRVDATSTDAAHAAASAAASEPSAGSAADQIAAAWAACYGLHPDPVAAYRDAIRAVESAAHAVIEPNNMVATLGSMLGQVRNHPELYRIVIPGKDGSGNVDPVIKMMEMLWQGQTSRHGGHVPTRDETPEEARMAVHLAVTLVQWFTSGDVRHV